MHAILISEPLLTRREADLMASMMNRAADRPVMVPFVAMPHGRDKWAVYIRPLYVKAMTVAVPERQSNAQ